VGLAAQYARELWEEEKATASTCSASLSMVGVIYNYTIVILSGCKWYPHIYVISSVNIITDALPPSFAPQAHDAIDQVKRKLSDVIQAIDAVRRRSEDPNLTEGQRKSVLARLDFHLNEAKDIKEVETVEAERVFRECEAALDIALNVEQEVYNVVESLLAQRVYLARGGDAEAKKLIESVKAEVAKGDFTIKAKTLVSLQSVRVGLIKGTEIEKELQACVTQVG